MGRRKSSTVAAIPDFIAAAFRGEQPPHLLMSAFPYCDALWHYWRLWKAEHPTAKPPQGFEFIAEEPPATLERKPYAEALQTALMYVANGEVK